MTRPRRQWVGLVIGTAIAAIAASAAVASAGGGHGSYSAAKLLFPFTMLLTRLSGDVITYPLMGLALVQFPFYGWLAASFPRQRTWLALTLVHVAAVLVCFSGPLQAWP